MEQYFNCTFELNWIELNWIETFIYTQVSSEVRPPHLQNCWVYNKIKQQNNVQYNQLKTVTTWIIKKWNQTFKFRKGTKNFQL